MLSSCVRVIGKYEINIYLFKLYLNIAINVFFIKIGYLKLKTLKKKGSLAVDSFSYWNYW